MRFILTFTFLWLTEAQGQFPYSTTTGEWLHTNSLGGVNLGYYAGIYDPLSDGINIGFAAGGAGNKGNASSINVGRHAGYDARNADQSIFLGHASGQYARNASQATVIGYLAARNASQNPNSSCFLAAVFGSNAATNAASIQVATLFGASVAANAGNVSSAVMAGYAAGHNAVNGKNAVLVGCYAGGNAADLMNCIYLGNQAGYELSRNHTLLIEANPDYRNTGLIYGEFDNRILRFNATQMGFLGAPSAPRQTITGSRSDGSALASLLQALAMFGFITDATTP